MFSRYIDNFDFKSRFRILKGGKISLVVSALLGSVIVASAAPTGGVVTSGNATINQSGNTTNINQTTQKASINWQNFNVGSNETVNFNQPNKNSITLNRVIGNEKSVIDGTLNANGQVWILNSNGILFNSNAKVNTSGLVATTAELSDKDFQDGNYNFKNSKSNSVVNLGTIEVANNGYVVLASNEVKNSGTIKAIKGKVFLSGNSEYTINLNGNSIVNLIVTKGVLDALAENSGTIIANGGEIYLTTNAVNELLKGVVNNTGVIEANSLDDVTGKVEVYAHGGTANVGGSINAEGGFVETSGKDFNIQPNAKIKAKEWLIDPVNITIDSTLAGTISTALDTADVTITTDGNNTPSTTSGESGAGGNIYVFSPIYWNTAKQLTLSAFKDIYLHANITADDSLGKLNLYYGQSQYNNSGNIYFQGGTVNLKSGDNLVTKFMTQSKTWTVVNGLSGMSSMTLNNSSKNYALGSEIDASGANGYIPIGTSSSPFDGYFNGLGHTISNLSITGTNYIGLFGYTGQNSNIMNIYLNNLNINATGNAVGGLVGYNQGNIERVGISGNIVGGNIAGGIVGNMWVNQYQTRGIKYSYSNASVKGGIYVGGIIGQMSEDNGASAMLSYSYFEPTSTISGQIYHLYGTNVGGLIGYYFGQNTGSNHGVQYCYVNGAKISGTTKVAGIIGDASKATIWYTYSTAEILNGTTKKALLGDRTLSSVSGSFWNSSTVGSGISDTEGTGKTTSEMKTTQLWNPDYIDKNSWIQQLGSFYPILAPLQNNAVYIKVNDATGSSGSQYTSGNGYLVAKKLQNSLDIDNTSTITYNYLNTLDSASTVFPSAAGDYIISGSGLKLTGLVSQQDVQKYGMAYINGKLTLSDAIQVNYNFNSLSNNTYIYKGAAYLLNDLWSASSLFGNNYSNWELGKDYKFKYNNGYVTQFKDVGNYNNISVEILKNGYSVATANNTKGSFSITPKAITVTADAITKTYGDINPSLTYSLSENLIGNDTLTGSLATTATQYSDVGNYGISSTLANSNYAITFVGNDKLTINKKDINILGLSGVDKIYDGTTIAQLNGTATLDTNSIVNSDNITISGTAVGNFLTSNAEDNKAITVSGITISGTKAGNYNLGAVNGLTANVSKKTLTVNGLTVDSKTYDGTNGANVLNAGSIDKVNGDDVNFSTIATFNNADVESSKTVNLDYTLNGTKAGNYILRDASNVSTSAKINAKPITGILASLNGIYGTALTLPIATLSDANANNSTNVKVYNAQNVDVTSQAVAGTLVAGTYTVKAENSNSNYSLANTTATLTVGAKPTITEISLPKINQIVGQPINFDGILNAEQISQGAKIVVLDATNRDVTELALQGKIQPGKYSVKAINENPNYALSSNEIELTINPALDPITVVKTQVTVPVIPVTTIITPKVAVVDVKPTTQLKQDVAVKLGITESSNISLVSQTAQGQAGQVVSLNELKVQTTTETQAKDVSDIRVPLGNGSLVELVNGGVTLPTGVEQQFYVVKQDMNAINQSNSSNLNNETKDNKSKGTN